MHSLKRFDGSGNICLGWEWSAMALICSSDFNKISKEWRDSEATAALSKTKTETKVEAIPTTRAAQTTTESSTHKFSFNGSIQR